MAPSGNDGVRVAAAQGKDNLAHDEIQERFFQAGVSDERVASLTRREAKEIRGGAAASMETFSIRRQALSDMRSFVMTAMLPMSLWFDAATMFDMVARAAPKLVARDSVNVACAAILNLLVKMDRLNRLFETPKAEGIAAAFNAGSVGNSLLHDMEATVAAVVHWRIGGHSTIYQWLMIYVTRMNVITGNSAVQQFHEVFRVCLRFAEQLVLTGSSTAEMPPSRAAAALVTASLVRMQAISLQAVCPSLDSMTNEELRQVYMLAPTTPVATPVRAGNIQDTAYISLLSAGFLRSPTQISADFLALLRVLAEVWLAAGQAAASAAMSPPSGVVL